MQDRFKFRAVLKTDTHSIITEPYYIIDNGYLVNIVDAQKPFEKKYPDDCFWEFLEEIEKQENCQEISTDSEIIIFNSFNGLIQCTGLKDKNGTLIYEADIVRFKDNITINGSKTHISVIEHNEAFNAFMYHAECMGLYTVNKAQNEKFNVEVIGNIYENPELLEVGNGR